MILKDLDTANKTLIDNYIENKPDAKLEGRSRLESLNGETKIIQGYCLPTKLIFYNINNGILKDLGTCITATQQLEAQHEKI